jgi:DNA-binding NarL/FixJ family response regulator
LIVLGVSETEADVLSWAEAGIAGYIPNTASIENLISMIDQIRLGEQICPPRISGSLLRRVSTAQRVSPAAFVPPMLTPRELEILRLVGDGLSNKEIARRLSVSLGTTKSHVHNILGKLNLHRRAEVMTRLSAGPR